MSKDKFPEIVCYVILLPTTALNCTLKSMTNAKKP